MKTENWLLDLATQIFFFFFFITVKVIRLFSWHDVDISSMAFSYDNEQSNKTVA